MRIVEKPWGHEEIWAFTEHYVGKMLYIKDGHRLSLQYHQEKEETIRVMKGKLTMTIGNNIKIMDEGEVVHIPPNTIHRMEAKNGDVFVVEVSTPQLQDVVRLSDDYNRS